MDQKILIFFSLVFFYPNRWVFYLMVHSMMIMIVSCICNLLREFSLYVYNHNIGICFIKWKTFASSNVFQLNIVRDILECIQSLKNVHETNENWTIVFTKRKKNFTSFDYDDDEWMKFKISWNQSNMECV